MLPGKLAASRLPLRCNSSDAATPIHRLNVDQLLQATWFLGAYATCNTAKAEKIAGVMQLDRSISLVEAVVKVLFDWPQGFNSLLDKPPAAGPLLQSGHRRKHLQAMKGPFWERSHIVKEIYARSVSCSGQSRNVPSMTRLFRTCSPSICG